MHREIIAVCSEIHKKTPHTNVLCGQNIDFFFLSVKPGSAQNVTAALKRVPVSTSGIFSRIIPSVACKD